MIMITMVPSPPPTPIFPPDRPRRSSMFVLSRSPRQRIVLFASAGFVVAERRRTMCQRNDPLMEFWLLARLRFLWRARERQFLCAANHDERRLVADAFFGQQLVQVVDAGDGPIVKADDDVTFAKARFLTWALLFEGHHENSTLNRKVVVAHDASRQPHVLSGESDITAADFAVANQAAGDKLRRVDRRREADALCRQDHRSVDADHFAARVDEWST